MSTERTTFLIAPSGDSLLAPHVRHHCLVELGPLGPARRHRVPPTGLTVGRLPPAALVVSDSEVSRNHCHFTLFGERLLLMDAGSTNGTFVDDQRVQGTMPVPVGATVRIGARQFRHEVLTEQELHRAEDLERDMEIAIGYVRGLLPEPRDTGPVTIDWHFEPSARLGGDAFGCEPLEDGRWIVFLLDVSGHGAGAALHAVAITNLIRQRAFGADPADPGAVLAALDHRFPMDAHSNMFVTVWYGLFDPATRELRYASAGHHAAYLCVDGAPPLPLSVRNRMIGAGLSRPFQSATTTVPRDASLYVFSDGVFEIDVRDGRRWGLADFVPLLPTGPVTGAPASIYQQVREQLRGPAFEDDFSLLGVTFA